MSVITINGKDYPFDRLSGLDQRDMDSAEGDTLNFCRQWFAGQERFAVCTSGSTGKPKPIILERRQMIASARLTGRTLGLQPADRTLVCLPTRYIAGRMMLVRGFELGLSLIVITPCSNPLAGFRQQDAFEFAAFTPLQLHSILTQTPARRTLLNGMRAILVGGAPVTQALAQAIGTLKAPVYHTYGMTETASHVALRPLNGDNASGHYTPLEGVKIGQDTRGCLTIRSPLTRQRTLVTNDLIELRADGAFRWLGRIDNVINTGGIKVPAEKVEAALETLFQNYREGSLARRRFFVGPLGDESLGQAVVAVIEGPSLPETWQKDIRQCLLDRSLLEKYEVPRYFYCFPRLSETATGKIDRPANLARIRGLKS